MKLKVTAGYDWTCMAWNSRLGSFKLILMISHFLCNTDSNWLLKRIWSLSYFYNPRDFEAHQWLKWILQKRRKLSSGNDLEYWRQKGANTKHTCGHLHVFKISLIPSSFWIGVRDAEDVNSWFAPLRSNILCLWVATGYQIFNILFKTLLINIKSRKSVTWIYKAQLELV